MANNKKLHLRPSFFKPMIGDFLTNLRIPAMFTKYQGDNVGDEAVLRDCRGLEWRVKIRREGNSLFFDDGWASFVSDHQLSTGNFPVFFFDGGPGFDVKIHDNTCCEKEKELFTDTFSSKKRKADNALLRKNKHCVTVLRGSIYEDEAALKAACAFQTSHPCFVSACRGSRLTFMSIPAKLVTKFNLARKKSMILRVTDSEKEWSAEICKRHARRYGLGLGWYNFYEDNCLKSGDACVFEFLRRGSAVMVHIFRAAERTVPKYRKRKQGMEEETPNRPSGMVNNEDIPVPVNEMDASGMVNNEDIPVPVNEVDVTLDSEGKVKKPKSGMLFSDLDALKEYYESYGNEMGFLVIRRTSMKGADGEYRYVTFACSRSIISRPIARSTSPSADKTVCKARMRAAKCLDGNWRVTSINHDHSHALSLSK